MNPLAGLDPALVPYARTVLLVGAWLTGALVCRALLTEDNWKNLAKAEAEARAKSPTMEAWVFRAARTVTFLAWPLVVLWCTVVAVLSLVSKLGDPPRPPGPPAGGGAGA